MKRRKVKLNFKTYPFPLHYMWYFPKNKEILISGSDEYTRKFDLEMNLLDDC